MVETEEMVTGTTTGAPAADAGTTPLSSPSEPMGGETAPAGQEPSAGTAGEGFYVGSYKSKEEAEKGYGEKEETISRLTSEKDRYAHAIQQLSPYFEYDPEGRVVGVRNLAGQQAPKVLQDTEIAEALLDPERASEALKVIEDRVANKIGNQMSLMQRQQQSDNETLKLFPELKDQNSEIFKETQKEFNFYSPETRRANPELVLTAAKAAFANIMAKQLPDIQARANDDGRQAAYRTRLMKGGSSVAVGQGVSGEPQITISPAERHAMEQMGISEDRWIARKKTQLERVAVNRGGKRI